MTLLLDTHVLLMAVSASHRLSPSVRTRINDPVSRPVFSAASLWEIAGKSGSGLRVDLSELRQALLSAEYVELPVDGIHVLEAARLPSGVADPFDRILVAQARVESLMLLTADAELTRLQGPVELI